MVRIGFFSRIKILWLAALLLPAGTVFASSIRASSYGWNAADASIAFRNAIQSSFDTIIVDRQGGNWVVGPNAFNNLSNRTIVFEQGVVLSAKPGTFPNTGDCLFRLNGAGHVTILGYGAVFKMQKPEYTTGEWRHCLSLVGCSDVKVYGLVLKDCGGDGVYVAGNGGARNYCENILLRDLWCDNNRRQGISVISAQHVKVERCWFTGTIGTLPEFGIDLEPNDSTDRLVDVVFDKCRITGNNGSGIGVAVLNLDTTSPPLSVSFRNCYLSSNHTVSNAYAPCEIALGDNGNNSAVRGSVTFDQCMVENSRWTAVHVRKTAYGYKANFNDCIFKDVSQDTTLSAYNCPVFVEVTDYSNACPRFGGAAFTHCLFVYGTKYNYLGSYGEDATSPGMGDVQLKGVTVINPKPVTWNATQGGGTPALDCVFDARKFSSPVPATVSYSAGANLIECSATNSVLAVNRGLSSDTSYPLGIACSAAGDGVAGVDFSRMNGFEIIPQGAYTQADTFLVLPDDIAEPSKNFTVTLTQNPCFTTVSPPQLVTIRDCGQSPVRSGLKVRAGFRLYSNVSDGIITLSYSLPSISSVMVRVFDIRGRAVTPVVDQKQAAGCHSLVLKTDGLRTGVYFLRLDADDVRSVNKLSIVAE